MARSSAFSGGFAESAFREAITETMKMGMPEDPAERLVFVWPREQAWAVQDPQGLPYDFTTAPTSDYPGNARLPDTGGEQTLSVPYALEAGFAAGTATPVGEFETARVTVTMFERDYDRVKTAGYARIGDAKYRILYDAPVQGLFGVGIVTLYLQAQDEA